MKVGNIVKWCTDSSGSFALIGGIVIDTCVIDGLPHATVFWFDMRSKANHPYMHLTTISRI